MRRLLPLCVLLCSGFALPASADPLLFGTGHLTTSGVFNCFNIVGCSASGSTVTIGSGANVVTLTFTGVDTTFPVMNTAVPLSLGTFTSTGTGDQFPTGINPNIPFVKLSFELKQDAPSLGTGRLGLGFGPGGGTQLGFMQGNTYMTLPAGGFVPAGYNLLVYTLSPDVFYIPLNGSVNLTANAGVVPEPGTMVLVGSGLVLAWRARRRVRRAAQR
jgi:hypothetical protein